MGGGGMPGLKNSGTKDRKSGFGNQSEWIWRVVGNKDAHILSLGSRGDSTQLLESPLFGHMTIADTKAFLPAKFSTTFCCVKWAGSRGYRSVPLFQKVSDSPSRLIPSSLAYPEGRQGKAACLMLALWEVMPGSGKR